MAQAIGNNQVKLDNGQTVQAQNGGWYDGQQFWNGNLGPPGVGNNPEQTDIYQKNVPDATIAQTNPANVPYIQQRRQEYAQQGGSLPGGSGTSAGFPGSASGSSGASGDGAGAGFQAPEPINLPKLYESLYQSSGIRNIETDLNAKTMAYNDAVAKIKDNPYLSEATMTGRLSKLDQKFAADRKAIQDQIATKKADIETQLNLQTKQLDINNTQTKLAWEQFNSLLSAGALDNANGEDIANITRSTGISSQMIYSAINATKKKNNPVSVSQVDDGTNIYAVAIDSNGNVVNKQILSASKPSKSGGTSGGKIGSTEYNANAQSKIATNIYKALNSYGDISPQDWQQALADWLASGLKRQDFIDNFGQYADINRGDFESAYGFEKP